MDFETNKTINKIFEISGYIIASFIFTIIIFYGLKLLNKFPSNWNFLYILEITLIIITAGILIREFLR